MRCSTTRYDNLYEYDIIDNYFLSHFFNIIRRTLMFSSRSLFMRVTGVFTEIKSVSNAEVLSSDKLYRRVSVLEESGFVTSLS